MKIHLADHLDRTSRTFALTIPLLPEPTQTEVAVGYLLFRAADTLEDADWSPGMRRDALLRFAGVVDGDPSGAARLAEDWAARPGIEREDDARLLGDLPRLLDELDRLERSSANAIRWQLGRTSRGMAGFASLCDEHGTLVLESLPELRHYCYVVAGIVGELLTSLFLARVEVDSEVAQRLFVEAATFGEALQLVNVLKDEEQDVRNGRRLLPADVGRQHALRLAENDLFVARQYTRSLRSLRVDPGVVDFLSLTTGLASESLEALREVGPGAKIGRGVVARLLQRLPSRTVTEIDPRAVRGGLPNLPTGA